MRISQWESSQIMSMISPAWSETILQVIGSSRELNIEISIDISMECTGARDKLGFLSMFTDTRFWPWLEDPLPNSTSPSFSKTSRGTTATWLWGGWPTCRRRGRSTSSSWSRPPPPSSTWATRTSTSWAGSTPSPSTRRLLGSTPAPASSTPRTWSSWKMKSSQELVWKASVSGRN